MAFFNKDTVEAGPGVCRNKVVVPIGIVNGIFRGPARIGRNSKKVGKVNIVLVKNCLVTVPKESGVVSFLKEGI